MLSEQEQRKATRILENNRQQGGNRGNVWDYNSDEVPDALEDKIGIELMEYILEEDKQYLSSPQILRQIEVDATPNKVGCRMRLIGRKLGMDDEETDGFYSSNTTWNLDALRDNGLDELYEDARSVS